MTEDELRAVEARHERARDGIWQTGIAGQCNLVAFNGEDILGIGIVNGDWNREFIAHAHQDIPRLAAALREAWSDGKRLQDEVAALDAARREAEAAAAEMREALRPLWTAASAYRQQEQDDTPRMCRGKALHDLGIVLDAAIASAEPSIRSPTPGAALLAERDRLREALADALRWFDGVGYPRPSDLNARSRPLPTWTLDARAALKETSNG